MLGKRGSTEMGPHLRVCLAMGIAVCASACAGPQISGGARGDGPGLEDGMVVVHGGVLVRPGQSMLMADLALDSTDHGLVLRKVAKRGEIVAQDTIDASGMYVHSSHAFNRSLPALNEVAMYVLRTGASPGDSAVGRIGPRGWEPISENHPPGPVDERVGCYAVNRAAWDDPETGGSRWVPNTLRLHWQYMWLLAREKSLVATDIGGHVGQDIVYYGWSRGAADSLRVDFHEKYVGVSLRLAKDGRDYVGVMTAGGDTSRGRTARSRVRLSRINCPTEFRNSR